MVNINYAVKHLLVFCTSRTHTVTLEIFLSLEHCCLLSTPHFAELCGPRQRWLLNERIFP